MTERGYPLWGRGNSVRDSKEAVDRPIWGVFHVYPGCTNITEHSVDTGDATPVQLPPYQLPHAYCEQVQQELKEMFHHGIIEPSQSDWAAPMVLVKKKDGTLRVCVDYRRLNAISRVHAYPMPEWMIWWINWVGPSTSVHWI